MANFCGFPNDEQGSTHNLTHNLAPDVRECSRTAATAQPRWDPARIVYVGAQRMAMVHEAEFILAQACCQDAS